MKNETLRELVVPVDLRSYGLSGGVVFVRTDMAGIRQDRRRQPKGEPRLYCQEAIVRALVEATENWAEGKTETKSPVPEVVLTDAAIIHGFAYDVMALYLFKNVEGFLQYVREVVQQVRHVMQTQTGFFSPTYLRTQLTGKPFVPPLSSQGEAVPAKTPPGGGGTAVVVRGGAPPA